MGHIGAVIPPFMLRVSHLSIRLGKRFIHTVRGRFGQLSVLFLGRRYRVVSPRHDFIKQRGHALTHLGVQGTVTAPTPRRAGLATGLSTGRVGVRRFT
jgi:hypothetical protein